MKKFFSSLLLSLTVLITASPVRADGESISSVTVVGATEQNGTPTPTTPIDIVSNNGVLKVSKNLFDEQWNRNTGTSTSAATWGQVVVASGYSTSGLIPVQAGRQYTISYNTTVQMYVFYYESDGTMQQSYNITSGTKKTFTVPEGATHIRLQVHKSSEAQIAALESQLEVGSTPTPYMPYGQIYTDGEVETIADSANHTATVATLLGVGDYRDTQNINTGAITRNVGIKVLNGTENWRWQSYLNNYFTITTAQSNMPSSSSYLPGYSNMFPVVDSAGAVADNTMRLVYARFSIRYDTANGDVNAFKQFLAAQYANGTPVIVVYPLATPTTESVTGQTMTTAPVNNRTGGVAGMTITTLLSSGASVVTTIATNAIKIATTAYNSARFNPVQTDLNNVVATIRDIVTNTINQTAAIASLQADKQTRPEDACPAGKKCLLVETEENGVIVPHWFPIIEAPEDN